MSTQLLVPATKKSLVLPPIPEALADRTRLSDEDLSSYIENAVLTLKLCAPFVEEMRRRFTNLDRTKQVDGSYKRIRGCRSFKEYCTGVLKRTEQAVYKMLRDRDATELKTESEPETNLAELDWQFAIALLTAAIPKSLKIPDDAVHIRKLGGNFKRPFQVTLTFATPEEIKKALRAKIKVDVEPRPRTPEDEGF